MTLFSRRSRSLSSSSAESYTAHQQEKVMQFVRSSAAQRRNQQSLGKPWEADNILKGARAPVANDWWIGDNLADCKLLPHQVDSDESTSVSEDSSSRSCDCLHFRNCGLQAWEKRRAEWKKAKQCDRKDFPPPFNIDVEDRKTSTVKALAHGLCRYSRNYDLPGPMNLRDLVSVYGKIWGCDDSSDFF